MKYTQPCPVCGKTMEGQRYCIDVYEGQGPTSEDYISCEGHYSYEFAFGGTRVRVGDKEFGYSYDTPASEIHEVVCAWTTALEEFKASR